MSCIASNQGDSVFQSLVAVPLVTEPLVAVVSRDHPLAARDAIRAADLTGNVVWTIQEEGSVQFARRVEQLLLGHGAQPRFVPVPWQNGQNSYTRIAFVDSGVFVHFASVAKYSMPVTSNRHKVLRFEEPGMEITVSAVWRENDPNEARTGSWSRRCSRSRRVPTWDCIGGKRQTPGRPRPPHARKS